MIKPTIVFFLLLSSISFLQMNCKKEPPVVPPDPPIYVSTIGLTADEIGLSEVWLKIKTTDTLQPRTIQLTRNSLPLFMFTLAAQETTIVDTAALPQRNYSYRVLRIENNKAKDSSKALEIKTMDTTSHDFIWTLETIGYQNSIIRDVAIVNDTLVYAVGKFYEKDTSTNTQTPFNVAQWNGKMWKLLRVMVEHQQIPPTPPHYYFPDEIYGIHVFAPDEIWFATSIEFIRWDGIGEKGKEYIYMRNTPVQTLWGTSPNNIFGAGGGGVFVHYNGTSWTKLDSLTNTTMTDIYGTEDGKEVWVTGWDSNGKCAVLRYRNNVVQKLYEWNMHKPDDFLKEYIRSLWIYKQKVYLPSSSTFIYSYSLKTDKSSIEKFQIQYFPYSIRGSNENNIVIACEFGVMYHFNGSTWRLIDQLANQDQSPYGGVAVSKNLVVVGGARYYGIFKSGFVLMGKK
ncbi:MAG TPA: hypothetical protein DCQ28_04430 [Bacteroidetes bacterium]|nr:hypothetical protein [Bacteroidota bacterium]